MRRKLANLSWRRIVLALVGALLAPVVLVGVVALFTPLPAELAEAPAPSIRVHARTGELLREVRTDDGERSRPLPLSAFPPHVRSAVLAAEDRHFYRHVGIDPVAVGRAAVADVFARRIVSGASTITMQLARTLRPHRRSLWEKIAEAALALRIEAALSKDRILEEYLNRVVYGPNVRGYAAASAAYLGAEPDTLSLAQAALIAGLPRGPSLYDVTKRPALAKKRRDRILGRMADAGMIDEAARDRALGEPLVPALDRPAFGAPHLVRGLVRGDLATATKQPGLAQALAEARGRGLSDIETTIDPAIQRAAEAAVTATIASLTSKHVTAASVVVLDNAGGDVLAWVGSPDFYGTAALGQNDGVLALRQPGSALKPFVYAEAMTTLGYSGATVLPDLELHIPLPGGGDYVPHDYDERLRGPVRLREALGNSLNVPAVDTIHRLGTARVLERLRAFGFDSLTEDAEHYGPALALGDGEVTLLALANAYATLARGGLFRPVRVVRRLGDTEVRPAAEARRVLDERIAAIVTDILADKTARISAFGDQNALELDFDVAAKTGTSKGYRDNVAVGYTAELTVAVWAGNFDGSPMVDVSGIAGAGPIFHDVMLAVGRLRPSRAPLVLAAKPETERSGLERTAVCALSGEIATAACPHRIHEWLPAGDAEHAPPCSVHARVRVDAANGLPAGPACEASETSTRVLERWPAPFQDWAKRTGRAVVPEESSPRCPVDLGASGGEPPRGGDALRIAYPFDGARFVVDPERPQELQLLDVRVEPDGRDVEVAVDGRALRGRRWPLAPGEHTLVATRRGRDASPVRITVR